MFLIVWVTFIIRWYILYLIFLWIITHFSWFIHFLIWADGTQNPLFVSLNNIYSAIFRYWQTNNHGDGYKVTWIYNVLQTGQMFPSGRLEVQLPFLSTSADCLSMISFWILMRYCEFVDWSNICLLSKQNHFKNAKLQTYYFLIMIK